MHVESVNVSAARSYLIDGRSVRSGIGKRPVAGPVGVGPRGLVGDEQADHTVHGGLAKAVYAYPAAHYAFWQTVRAQARVGAWGEPLPFGSVGENLTIEGLLESELWIGDVLRLPGCVLSVSAPRFPCFKFAHVMGFAQAAKLMVQSGFCGAYLGVLEEGHVQAGDSVELRPGAREVSLMELFRSRAP
jgi:MOSC domain-containing protein YiiM